jgi:hypothetical protein
MQEGASCGSELHSPFGSEQQFNAEFLFQIENGLADRGLGNMQTAGGFAVVQMMSDADEVTQMAKLHNFMLIAESDYYKRIIRFPRWHERSDTTSRRIRNENG